MNHHTQLLNYLVERYNLKSYLEIGVQNPANNFNKINIGLTNKVGVDPEINWQKQIFICTSDTFFTQKMKEAQYVGMGQYPSKFDLVFIDGLHRADQVQRDFKNSLACLNDGGFIVIHDVLPEKEETTHVPRDSKVWHGDVWKFAFKLNEYQGINFVTLNFDNGCCVVWKSFTNSIIKIDEPFLTWGNYLKHRKNIMNIIEASELDKYLPKLKETIQ